MNDYTLVIAEWDALRDHARAIRWSVFIEEQGVPVELEWDAFDAVSWHAIAYDHGIPVATGRLLPDGHVGRMAVLKRSRGLGIGGAILEALMAKAAALGYPELILNAQASAVPFYARFGFTAEGDEFIEAGITHRAMRKWIASAPHAPPT
jgi:predicted GNAT family N-acyltransferase